jgi:bifunctional DNA-binding transcriptional regulator/antitoxin component of YhaV-PrlF toxin-antitoxin module
MKHVQGPAGPCVVYSYIGNLGCVRFPEAIKKATGIKRGDRLAITVARPQAVILSKASPGDAASTSVGACSCETRPEGCGAVDAAVTVGWSYVQFGEALARSLGFLSGEPIQLIGEWGRVTVQRHDDPRDLVGIPPVVCPP